MNKIIILYLMGMLFTGCDILVNNIGCNDPDALNYDFSVEEGDGSCVYYYKDFNNTGGWVNTGWTYSIGGVNKCYDESDCLLSYSNPSTIHKELDLVEDRYIEMFFNVYSPHGTIGLFLDDSLLYSHTGYGSDITRIRIPHTGMHTISITTSGEEYSSIYIDEFLIVE